MSKNTSSEQKTVRIYKNRLDIFQRLIFSRTTKTHRSCSSPSACRHLCSVQRSDSTSSIHLCEGLLQGPQQPEVVAPAAGFGKALGHRGEGHQISVMGSATAHQSQSTRPGTVLDMDRGLGVAWMTQMPGPACGSSSNIVWHPHGLVNQ